MTKKNSSEREPPDLLIEQLALGELDEARAAPLRAELEREAAEGGRDRLAEIAASNAAILAEHPPERVAAEIRRRLERAETREQARRPARLWLLAPALAAAVVLIWVVTREPECTKIAELETTTTGATLIDPGTGELTRIKGGVEPHLVIDRRTDEGHERLATGEVVREGDLVQVSYVPAGRRAGVIVSIDGAGAVTLHHPSEGSAEPILADGEEVPLAHAYELDDAPSFERFVLVTRDHGPIAVAQVLAAAEQLASNPKQARSAPLVLEGEGWMQHSIVLDKPAPDLPTPAGEGDP